MKRTRKTRKTFTLTQKRGLVNKVMTLLNQGVNLTKARLEVARKNGTTPISLARWATNPTITTVAKSNGRIASKVANNISTVHVTSVDLHVPGKGIVKLDHQLLTHISKLAGYTG